MSSSPPSISIKSIVGCSKVLPCRSVIECTDSTIPITSELLLGLTTCHGLKFAAERTAGSKIAESWERLAKDELLRTYKNLTWQEAFIERKAAVQLLELDLRYYTSVGKELTMHPGILGSVAFLLGASYDTLTWDTFCQISLICENRMRRLSSLSSSMNLDDRGSNQAYLFSKYFYLIRLNLQSLTQNSGQRLPNQRDVVCMIPKVSFQPI